MGFQNLKSSTNRICNKKSYQTISMFSVNKICVVPTMPNSFQSYIFETEEIVDQTGHISKEMNIYKYFCKFQIVFQKTCCPRSTGSVSSSPTAPPPSSTKSFLKNMKNILFLKNRKLWHIHVFIHHQSSCNFTQRQKNTLLSI